MHKDTAGFTPGSKRYGRFHARYTGLTAGSILDTKVYSRFQARNRGTSGSTLGTKGYSRFHARYTEIQ